MLVDFMMQKWHGRNCVFSWLQNMVPPPGGQCAKGRPLSGIPTNLLVLVRVCIYGYIMTKKQVREERVYSAYTFILLFITKGSQDRNSHTAGTWRWELIQRLWRSAACWIASPGLLSLLSYRTQDYCPGMAPPTMAWALPPWSLIEKMPHIFCIHSSVEGHLGSFQLLAIINKAAMNIVEHVSFLPVGASSGYMPRRGIAGSSGSTMSNFLRNRQTDFQSGCTSLQSHQQWRSVPLSPHSYSYTPLTLIIECIRVYIPQL